MTDERAIEILEGMNMQDEQKQIEEMAKAMCEEYDTDICKHECPMATDCANILIAKRLIAAGYRKQSEVAKNIRDKIETQGRFEFCGADGKEYLTIRTDRFNEIIKAFEYGVEVEE